LGILVFVFSVGWTGFCAGGEDAAKPGLQNTVQQILKKRCLECHGPEKAKGDLNLASFEGMAKGGRNGPVVIPGKPGDSLLWQRVDKGEMPPKKPLLAQEKETLRLWIESGAAGFPRAGTSVTPGKAAADHWAFRR